MNFVRVMQIDVVRDLLCSFLLANDLCSLSQTSHSFQSNVSTYINTRKGLQRLWGPAAINILDSNNLKNNNLTTEEVNIIVNTTNSYALVMAANIDVNQTFKYNKCQVSYHLAFVKKMLLPNVSLHKGIEMFVHCTVLSMCPLREQLTYIRNLIEHYAAWIRVTMEQFSMIRDDILLEGIGSHKARLSLSMILLKLSILRLTHLSTQPLDAVVETYKSLWSVVEVDRCKSSIMSLLFMPLLEPFTMCACLMQTTTDSDGEYDVGDGDGLVWHINNHGQAMSDKNAVAIENSMQHLAEHVKLVYKYVAKPVQDTCLTNTTKSEGMGSIMSIQFYNLLRSLLDMMTPWLAALLLSKCGSSIALQYIELLIQQLGFVHCRSTVMLYILFIYRAGEKKSLEKVLIHILNLYTNWLFASEFTICPEVGLETLAIHIVESCHIWLLNTNRNPYLQRYLMNVKLSSMYEDVLAVMLSNTIQ